MPDEMVDCKDGKRNILMLGIIAIFMTIGSRGHAETVEYSCVTNNSFGPTSAPLLFDLVNERVKFANWPWSNSSVWSETFINWTSIGNSGSPGAFSFKRNTAELIVLVPSEAVWRRLENEDSYSDTISAARCVRGF